jgi:hypothetical protein
MQPTTIAISISVFALLVSCLSLGWNVYKELGLRGRIKVICVVGEAVMGPLHKRIIIMRAVNHGPGRVLLNGITLKNTWWARMRGRNRYFTIVPDFSDPLTTKLPATLDVGDPMQIVLPYNKECFLKTPSARVGLSDTFTRPHWASRKHLRRAREQYQKDFGGASEK